MTALLDFVRDMDRLGVPPFTYGGGARLSDLAIDMRQAALADDAQAVANIIRTTRLERLWRVASWLTASRIAHLGDGITLASRSGRSGWRKAKLDPVGDTIAKTENGAGLPAEEIDT
jgi:hypothetical protein